VKCDTSPPSAPLAFFTFMMLLAPVTNWEPHSVTLAGYCYAVRHGVKVQIVTGIVSVTCNVTALRYAVTLRVCTQLCTAFIYFCFLGAFANLRKATISLIMSVCPPPGEKSAVTERIFIKFYIRVFFEILSRNIV
jgi:hypothetical protein